MGGRTSLIGAEQKPRMIVVKHAFTYTVVSRACVRRLYAFNAAFRLVAPMTGTLAENAPHGLKSKRPVHGKHSTAKYKTLIT